MHVWRKNKKNWQYIFQANTKKKDKEAGRQAKVLALSKLTSKQTSNQAHKLASNMQACKQEGRKGRKKAGN